MEFFKFQRPTTALFLHFAVARQVSLGTETAGQRKEELHQRMREQGFCY